MSAVQSIERAFSILRVLARGPLGVTEIADRADLPKSTVSRILAALELEGAVTQVEAGGGYSIGPALATLGASAQPDAGLRSVIRPFLEELSMLTGGSSGFTIREGDTAYWVDDVDAGDELVKLADLTGQTFALHAIASGVAVLAQFSHDEIDAYVASHRVDADGWSLDVDALRRRIGDVGSDGAVVSREDLEPGVNTVAVPFRGPRGEWDGALYLQGPSFRFPDDGDERRIIKLVTEAASQVSDRLVRH